MLVIQATDGRTGIRRAYNFDIAPNNAQHIVNPESLERGMRRLTDCIWIFPGDFEFFA